MKKLIVAEWIAPMDREVIRAGGMLIEGEKIVELGKRIPDEELARLPTDGARNLRWTSACGRASHCRCRTSGRARASERITSRCSTAFSGKRSRERPNRREESG